MSRTMKQHVEKLNADLKRDLAKLTIKQRVTFHAASQQHEKSVKAKQRNDRRNTRAALRRGDW